MKYPKKLMNRKELIEFGFPVGYLNRAFATPGQRFAFRENPANRTSPILFETDGFEQWRQEDMAMQEKARKRRCGKMGI